MSTFASPVPPEDLENVGELGLANVEMWKYGGPQHVRLFTNKERWEASTFPQLQDLTIHECGNTKGLHMSTFASPMPPEDLENVGEFGFANVEMSKCGGPPRFHICE